MPQFDDVPASEVMRSLQTKLRQVLGVQSKPMSPAENEIWVQLGQLVRQAQEARKLMKRLEKHADDTDGVPSKKQNRSLARSELLISSNMQDEREEMQNETKIRPIKQASDIAPPSPVRNLQNKPFCARDIQATLEAMRRHKLNARIQEQGCRAIMELIKDGKKRRKLQLQDPPGSWSCASCHFRNGPSENACKICTCTIHSSNSNDSLSKGGHGASLQQTPEWLQVETHGGVPTLIDVIRNFRSDTRILRVAAFVLAQLVQEDASTVQRIAAAGGIGEILSIMRTLGTDQEIQIQCMGILASPELAADEVVRIESDLFVHVVCGSMRRDPGIARLQALGFLALANLGVKSDSLTNLLVSNVYRVHELALYALESDIHKDNPHVIASGLWLLVSLSRELTNGGHDKIREMIARNGAVQLTMGFLSRFPTHQSVQANGKLLLQRLGVSSIEEISSFSQDGDGCQIQ